MRELFNKFKWSFVISAIVSMVFGIALIIFPGQISSAICYVFGGLLVLLGIVLVVKFFTLRSVSSLFSVTLVAGIILAALGAFLIFYKDVAISAIPFIFGIFIGLDAIVSFQRSIILARSKFSKWWVTMLLAVLSLILGVVLVFNPFSAAIVMIRFMGVALVFNGIMDLIGTYNFTKNVEFLAPDAVVIEEEDNNKE